MKDTGIIRSLDSLGRIVIPTEIRATRNIEIGDPMEFFISNNNTIVIRKYRSNECTFCRSMENVTYYHEQFICMSCLDELKHSLFEAPPALISKQRKPHVADNYTKKTNEMLMRVKQAFLETPDVSQKELANRLGISQGRISQLKKELSRLG
ncbi:MAG: regulator [Gorillibacterium sp.]|nr:regulator [Gorillibacterium sp.]